MNELLGEESGSDTLEMDVAQRNRALQALNDLAVRLLGINSVAAVYETALDGVLEIVGSRKGTVALADDEHREFRILEFRGFGAKTRDLTRIIPYGTFAAHNLARQTRELVVAHTGDPDSIPMQVLALEGMRTIVSMPLFHGDHVVGALSYLLEERRDPTPGEREMLRTATTFVGAALERARLYEEAENERQRLARVLEQIPVGVFMAEGEAAERTVRWTLVNGIGQKQLAATRVTPGVESETFTVYHPDGTLFTEEELPIQRALWQGEEVRNQEMLFRYRDGTERIFEATTGLVRDEGGTREVIEVLQDVTERKRLEEQVRRHAEAVQAEYERLASIVATVDISLALFDASGHMVLANEAWYRRAGLGPHEMVGRRFTEFLPYEHPTAPIAAELVDKVLATGEPVIVREAYLYLDGQKEGFYVDWSVLPIRGPGGEITGAISASLDVTERVLVRKDVEAQRSLLATIVEGTPVGIAFYDSEMRLMSFNAEWARMMGIDPEGAQGRSIYELVPSSRKRRDVHARVLGGEPVDLRSVAYLPLDAERTHFFDVHLRPIFDSAGMVTGVLTALVDVTARVELDRQKDEFIALASHELRTPVTAIKGFASIGLRAANEQGNKRLARNLSIINEQSDRLIRLINELLDVSAAQSGPLPLHREKFDLRSLAEEVVESFELLEPELDFDLESTEDAVTVDADRQRIEQVLSNLLQNAIRYAGEGRRVEVRVGTEGKEAIVSVRDFGEGIPADQIEHLFERFFRADNTATRKQSGLGLGLYIAREIVTRHEGRIWLETSEKEGSTFSFSIPLNAEETPKARRKNSRG